MMVNCARDYYSYLEHGEIDKKRFGNVFYGVSIPVFLSKLGKLQLKYWGRTLKHIPLAAIYCSPLKRARQSAIWFQVGYYGFWKSLLWFLLFCYRILRALTDVEYADLGGRLVECNEIVLVDGSKVDLNLIDTFASESLSAVGTVLLRQF